MCQLRDSDCSDSSCTLALSKKELFRNITLQSLLTFKGNKEWSKDMCGYQFYAAICKCVYAISIKTLTICFGDETCYIFLNCYPQCCLVSYITSNHFSSTTCLVSSKKQGLPLMTDHLLTMLSTSEHDSDINNLFQKLSIV